MTTATRAPMFILESRKGYHGSHVVTPYIHALTSPGQREALKRFGRYQPMEPIAWRRAGRGLYWNTLKWTSLEDELLRMARRRQRGIRRSIAELGRWTGSSADMVGRVLRSLAARGMGMLEIGRGRYAKAVFRLVGNSIPQPNRYKAAGLTDEQADKRYMARFTEEELAKIEADAYAWRVGLARSLEKMGFTGPDAEADYLAYMDSIRDQL